MLRIVLWPRMYLANVKALEEKCILLLLDGLFYKCQLGQFSDSVVELFCLFVLSIIERRMLKYSNLSVDFSMSSCNCISFDFYILKLLLEE